MQRKGISEENITNIVVRSSITGTIRKGGRGPRTTEDQAEVQTFVNLLSP